MKTIIIAVASLALCSNGVLAQDASGATAVTPVAAAETEETTPASAEPDPGEEVICRSQRATGSLSRRSRICMTRNQWNDSTARTRDAVNSTVSGASGGVQCRQDQMGGC